MDCGWCSYYQCKNKIKHILIQLSGALIQEGLMFFFVEFLIVEMGQVSCIRVLNDRKFKQYLNIVIGGIL